MENRVRFAPSPTGKVHVGNIRTAIFNWLFARHTGGKFILRVEDTDRERSTQEAIDALLECMEWLGLDFDEEIMYQSKRADAHLEAVQKMISEGNAYKAPSKDGEATPTLFRIPWNCDSIDCVREGNTHEITVHPEEDVIIDMTGVNYAQISRKGKAVPEAACLAGFKDLKVYNAENECVFELNPEIDGILSGGKSFTLQNCSKFVFTRREVFFNDMIKGELAKPMDSMKDLVVVRSDGSPVFHIANVCDDMAQNITHIVRGDDHVENTYRHILLFDALGYNVPVYAHMPMIVNKQGKPYSKRDGDAFVGDFRSKGYESESFFNYLTLLGWSPGDDREKMNRAELIEAFELERVKSSPAQLDMNKLQNLNGMYLAEMEFGSFVEIAKTAAADFEWFEGVELSYFETVAKLLQTRTKLFSQVEGWSYFFTDNVEFNMKNLKKAIKKDEVRNALTSLTEKLTAMEDLVEANIEAAIAAAGEEFELGPGKLNQPVRVCVTGGGIGADLLETIVILGKDKSVNRIKEALEINFDA